MRTPKHLRPCGAWKGRVVRARVDMETKGGTRFKKGALFRVSDLVGGKFNLTQIDRRGRDVPGRRFIRRVHWTLVEPVQEVEANRNRKE